MRIHLDEAVLGKLTEDLMTVYEKKSMQPSDCKLLSASIFKKTGNHVSETTLKRLFGFAKRNFNFSLYTLDTFSGYLGYKNWDAYYNSFYLSKGTTELDSWEKLKTQAIQYSFYTLRATQNASGSHFSKTIHREAFTEYIKKFIKSQKSIAPIIAPAGYGKSVGLAQSVLKLWLGDNPVYPDDICSYVSVHQLYTITKNKNSLTEWFKRVLEVNKDISLEEYKIDKNQKFVIIIDGFDERTFTAEKLKHIGAGIIEFVNFHADYDWIKIIVSIRPSIWEKIVLSFITASFHHNKIFIDESYPDSNWLNHTLPLTKAEIKRILHGFDVPGKTVENFSDNFISFLSYPRHLDILSRMIASGPIPFDSEEYIIFKINEINLRFHFSNPSNSAGALNFLENLVELEMIDGKSDNRDKLIGLNNENLPNYLRLKDQNIVTEERISAHYLYPASKISFTTSYLKDYFLSWYLIKKNNYVISRNFIDELYTSFEKDFPRTGFIKWYLTESFCEKEPTAVMEIFRSQAIPEHEKFELFEFLVHQQIASGNPNFELLQKLDQENQFILYFKKSSTFFRYLNKSNETFLITLLKICSDEKLIPSLLLSLFMCSMLRLDISQSEIWLREFRLCTRNKSFGGFRRAETMMSAALELARYQIYEEKTEEAVFSVVDDYELLSDELPHFTHLLVLLGAHIFLFRRRYTSLSVFIEQVFSQIRVDKCQYNQSPAVQLLNGMYQFALYRTGKTKKPAYMEYTGDHGGDSGSKDICNAVFSHLINSAKAQYDGNFIFVQRFASAAHRLSLQAQFNVYRLLARDLMKEIQQPA